MLRWMLDSTVFFICCIISSGLKDTLDPGCVDGGATGGGGSDTCGVGCGWRWSGCGLMEREELLKVLDVRLSL